MEPILHSCEVLAKSFSSSEGWETSSSHQSSSLLGSLACLVTRLQLDILGESLAAQLDIPELQGFVAGFPDI
jgi:hypothetical protein